MLPPPVMYSRQNAYTPASVGPALSIQQNLAPAPYSFGAASEGPSLSTPERSAQPPKPSSNAEPPASADSKQTMSTFPWVARLIAQGWKTFNECGKWQGLGSLAGVWLAAEANLVDRVALYKLQLHWKVALAVFDSASMFAVIMGGGTISEQARHSYAAMGLLFTVAASIGCAALQSVFKALLLSGLSQLAASCAAYGLVCSWAAATLTSPGPGLPGRLVSSPGCSRHCAWLGQVLCQLGLSRGRKARDSPQEPSCGKQSSRSSLMSTSLLQACMVAALA